MIYLVAIVIVLFIITIFLGMGITYYFKKHSEEILSDDIEKYFTEQDKDRTFPQHNMDSKE